MKLRNIWFSFFQGMLNSSFIGGYCGVPLRVGLSASKSSPGCGLSVAIPNVGERDFTFWIHFFGIRAVSPHSIRFRPLRQAAWWGAGVTWKKTNRTHPSVPLPGTKFIIGISLSRPSLSRMNGNSYFTFAVISSIRFVIFSMEYFSINLLFAASVFSLSLINFSWGRSDWQHSFKYSISVP